MQKETALEIKNTIKKLKSKKSDEMKKNSKISRQNENLGENEI